MTKMLDVLERFLNYHGYIYLRLDGNTKVEQRQVNRKIISHVYYMSRSKLTTEVFLLLLLYLIARNFCKETK